MASAQVSNPQSWNRYSYVLNKPMNLIDPDGLAARSADGSCSAEFESCSEEEGGDAALSAYETRLGHQYNAMAATRAANNGDWDTFNDLMAADPTLVAVSSEPQIVFKRVELLDSGGDPVRQGVQNDTTGNFKLDVLTLEPPMAPNPTKELLRIKVTFVAISATLDEGNSDVTTTNESNTRWALVNDLTGNKPYKFDMGTTTGTVIFNVRAKDVEAKKNNQITVKVSANFTKDIWERGQLNQPRTITKRVNIKLFIGKKDDNFR